MAEIRLFVSCHKPTRVPEHPLLVPVQVGAALARERFPGFLYDDAGENISPKNPSYCELTAQYWAWKNDFSTTGGISVQTGGARAPTASRLRPPRSVWTGWAMGSSGSSFPGMT